MNDSVLMKGFFIETVDKADTQSEIWYYLAHSVYSQSYGSLSL